MIMNGADYYCCIERNVSLFYMVMSWSNYLNFSLFSLLTLKLS